MAANLAVLNTVYNHYLTTYNPKSSSPFDTHKKSELRNVYNTIVKQSKESPLFLLNHTPKESGEFAIDVKESTLQLRHTIASLGGLNAADMLAKKSAFSTNENMVSAKFIGTPINEDEVPSFSIEVLQLASPQVNIGNYLPAASTKLASDDYSFDIALNDLNYEFQFAIRPEDANRDVQERLARLITNANIGITASVLENETGQTALRLESLALGNQTKDNTVFTISDQNTSKMRGAVSYFGISDMVRPPSDATFLINGEQHSSSSNSFTVEKMYELTLNGIRSSEGDTTTIGLKTSVESLSENISTLVNGYNAFLGAIQSHEEDFPRSKRLTGELTTIANAYKNELEAVGLPIDENGIIAPDFPLLEKSLSSDDPLAVLGTLKDFTSDLLSKANQVALNPLEYIDKTIVAYKNPTRLFANPYITSSYSGLLFNSYC